MTHWQWSGARWWKFDFHAHTPASADYGAGNNQASARSLTPREWLLNYMRAGIDCVAVTDHNTGDWVDDLKRELHSLENQKHPDYRPLYLFPGMEISVHDSIHVLAIFGPQKTKADLDVFRGAIRYKGTPGDSDGVTELPFNQVIEEIIKADGIAIPAHVDQGKGLFQEVTGTTLQHCLDCPHILAIEVCDVQASKPQLYLDAKKNWSEILGSDSHHPAGQAGQRFPGSHFTWVKMGQPSLEGLKLALLDGSPLSIRRSDQGTQDPNAHAENIIESLEVSEAYYLGRKDPFTVTFNPWLNAIIGGRGTGKSTLIEFLRLTLRRWGELPPDYAEEFKKYREVSAARGDGGLLTANTKLRVIYRKADARFRLNWNPSGTPPVIEEEVNGVWQEAVGEVQQRFPVRMYSQKQIFHLAKNPAALLQMIDEALGAVWRTWQEDWRREEQQYLTLCAKIRELEAGFADEARLRGELEDIKHKLGIYEKSHSADVLKTYRRYKRQEQEIGLWEEGWCNLGERLRQFVTEALPDPPESSLFIPEQPADQELLAKIHEMQQQLQALLDRLLEQAKELDRLAAAWSAWQRQSAWQQAREQALADYEALQQKLAAEGVSDPAVYGELVQRRQVLEQKIRELESRRQEVTRLQGEAKKSRERLLALRREITKKRRDFLESVLQNNPYVQIDVMPYGDKHSTEGEFRQLLQRQEGGFEKDIGNPETGEGWLGELYKEKADADTVEARLAKLKETVRGIAAGKDNEAALRDKRFVAYLQKLPPETFDRLDLWFPEDSLAVRYSPQGNSQNFQAIEQGSPGQKTAALLAFFLSYGKEPLILDQPEDDLDNHLIYGLIVKQLREQKLQRQIIVVTHNANIVVNGDAEFVLGLKVANGQTNKECAGSLQEKQVRETICAVMEGGAEAFKERYKRIALEDARV